MKTKFNLVALAGLALLSTINYQLSPVLAQGTAFTYQGQLQNNGALANGTFNRTFTLFNTNTSGTAVVGPVTNNGVIVSNGLFTVAVDFGGAAWNGETNWLEIAVETNGSSPFTKLSPRQQITPTPYAITAENLGSGGLSGTYGNMVTLNNPANQFTGTFTGDGSGLTNVNSGTLGGLPAGDFWQVGGNSGVPTGNNYIGNNDNQYLDIHANGVRVFRLRLLADGLGLFTNAPNVLGGSSVNLTSPNIVGAVIGGGGGDDTTGVAHGNEVEADLGMIGGGVDNTNAGIASFIGGGGYDGILYGGNTIYANAATIGGGLGNNISGSGSDGFIGGGEGNVVSNSWGTVAGGADNVAGGSGATVGGGNSNVATGENATIGGGGGFYEIGGQIPFFVFVGNTASGSYATVGGGADNAVSGIGSFIGGGGYDGNYFEGNSVQGNAAAICGGLSNNISGSGPYSFVGGGIFNADSGGYSVICGGISNSVTGVGSFIGGGG